MYICRSVVSFLIQYRAVSECLNPTTETNPKIKDRKAKFYILTGCPASFAAASIVGRFQLLIVSNTPSCSSPLVVNPVIFFPEMIGLLVKGFNIPEKIAPPCQTVYILDEFPGGPSHQDSQSNSRVPPMRRRYHNSPT